MTLQAHMIGWHPAIVRQAPKVSGAGTMQIVTLVLWLTCLAVGVAGLCLPYRMPGTSPAATEAVQAQLISVDVTQNPAALPGAGAPSLANEAAAPANAPPPRAPALPAVAEPSPEIAFALPIEGPTRTVNQQDAAFSRQPAKPVPPAAPRGPDVERLTYGQGEGAQPAPEYPREAIDARQQGAVGVRFTVGQDGRVTGAQVISPCRWPRLNQAALVTVRDRWRFRPGPPRLYEISIRFELN